MGAALEFRQTPLSAAEQTALWQRLCEDRALADVAYQVETDSYGRLIMSPAATKHSLIAWKVARLLEAKLGGSALPELAILTADGVKVPDVAWCSEQFMAQHWDDTLLRRAPEICAEIVSPNNTEAELRHKVELYLDLGATEVWLVSSDGSTVEVCRKTGVGAESAFGFSPSEQLS
jgi:Uma2 family endonuclease